MLNGNRVIAIRARARRGWSIKEIARTLGVSRNTVRRYLRRGPGSCAPEKTCAFGPKQEWDLLCRVAWRYNTPDRDELESHLITVVAKTYRKKAIVDDWAAFLAESLHNAALNWLRSRRRQERLVTPATRSPQPDDERDLGAVELAAAVDVNLDDRLALETVRDALSPLLQRVWDAMLAVNFDQTQAAKRLGLHRNTVGKALRQIGIILKQHGF